MPEAGSTKRAGSRISTDRAGDDVADRSPHPAGAIEELDGGKVRVDLVRRRGRLVGTRGPSDRPRRWVPAVASGASLAGAPGSTGRPP